MSTWLLKIVLLISLSFVQTHVPRHSRRGHSRSSTFSDVTDDSLTESHTANDEQLEQFTRLIFARLNIKQPPNVTINNHDGSGIPSIIKQLEKEHLHQTEEISSYQQQREEIQSTTDRVILPGDVIPAYACQRQLAAKFHFHRNHLHNIDCFRFTKSFTDSKSLPTNQIIKQIKIYVKKNYFYANYEQADLFKPDSFQIYQVFRPTSNDTSANFASNFAESIRLPISQVKQMNYKWFELTIDASKTPIPIQQIYQQFISPWYGMAISHVLQSPWSTFYRRYHVKKHLDRVFRSKDEHDEEESEESQQRLPYMLVEYGEKIPSSSRNRLTRHNTASPTPARPCDPKSPCCRRPLVIDLDQSSNTLDFVIYPRQLDIGECVGLCGPSGSSLSYTAVKNAQHQNEQHAAHNLFLIHQSESYRNRTGNNEFEQHSNHCCSYARTGGLDIAYTTRNGGPIIRKFLPNMVVEQCRCGLPATI